MTVPLLQAQGVRVVRRDAQGAKTVVEDATLDVAAGEVVVLAGRSGSGKSTLLRAFNRLLEPDAGRVLLAGVDIRSLDPPNLRAQVTLVPQKPFLFDGSVRDNLNARSRLRGTVNSADATTGFAELLEMCQVQTDWLERNAQRLSIGQQQRVCLARALAGPCRAVLLDEPTSALDWPTATSLAGTFRTLAKQRQLAVLMVTHDLRVAELCADRVAIIEDGRIIECGPAAAVLDRHRRSMVQETAEPGRAAGEGA